MPSLHSRLPEDFIAVTYAEHANPVDRERQSVLETSRGAGIAERQVLSAAILMVKERNRNGEAIALVIYTTDANID